jgi:hypothetical protein
MDSFKLSKVIIVQSQFGRSVNLERDFYNHVSLEGYVLTTTARYALSRLNQALTDNTAARAWTLTGAYGSGKSTFALFAAKLFSYKKNPETLDAQSLIREKDLKLWKTTAGRDNEVPKFFPILISGSREPLARAILRGVKAALLDADNKRLSFALARTEELERSETVTGRQLVELLAEISRAINHYARHPICLLVVIDELGKLLEFVSLRPVESDIFLLQELAEATRKIQPPFFLLTILHQAFERYAERLGRREREEWMKVQGRFEDLAFQEPNDQVLRILHNVFIQDKSSPHYRILNETGSKLGQTAYALGLCPTLSKRDAVSLLRDCLPLHPLVSLTLGNVFRRFGQNERSLFAFLTSNEAFGLTEFLATATWNNGERKLITLDRVYDYLISAMGSTLYAGSEGRKWAEIENALNRLVDGTSLEIKLIKTVGLLRLLGDLGNLKSSREVLHFALATYGTSTDIDDALENLQGKSILTERRFNDTFVIWEGSDVNLDERLQEAERNIDPTVSLAEGLTKYFRPRPLVAKRHSYKTGTLRYFDVVYSDADDVAEICRRDLNEADGRIVFALTANRAKLKELQDGIRQGQIAVNTQTVIAVPKHLSGLRDAIFATACWRWVRQNTPELENDRTARTELRARLFHAEQTVIHWLEELQSNTASENCVWFWQGEEQLLPSARHLQEFLSDVCDTVFPKTPFLVNELINRRSLSGAATSARRALFEVMLTNQSKPQLGIEGFPPQLSMYFSVLQETTIHRKEKGKFGFFPPSKKAEIGIRAVWQRIEELLEETEDKRRTIAELFQVLQEPPFGLKDGVLPILLVAALLHYDAEVALYERGNFLPKLSLPIFERLCRAPEAYTIQLCRIAGIRAKVLDKMAQVLLPERNGENKKRVNIVSLVRPLARFAQEVEDYTRHTSRLSPLALGIRRALFAAREPDKLIFKQLPEACGFAEFVPNKKRVGNDVVEKFARTLHAGLAELRRAYAELLRDIEEMLFSGFALRETGEAGRVELQRRSALIAEFAASPKLKSFVLRVSDTDLDLRTWLESIAALLAGKPPAVWQDDDLARFEIGLAETVRSFRSLENLSFERRNRAAIGDLAENDTELLRLSLTQMGKSEQERVLSIRPQDKELLEETERLLLDAFEKSRLNGNLNLRLAALATLSLRLLEQT